MLRGLTKFNKTPVFQSKLLSASALFVQAIISCLFLFVCLFCKPIKSPAFNYSFILTLTSQRVVLRSNNVGTWHYPSCSCCNKDWNQTCVFIVVLLSFYFECKSVGFLTLFTYLNLQICFYLSWSSNIIHERALKKNNNSYPLDELHHSMFAANYYLV